MKFWENLGTRCLFDFDFQGSRVVRGLRTLRDSRPDGLGHICPSFRKIYCHWNHSSYLSFVGPQYGRKRCGSHNAWATDRDLLAGGRREGAWCLPCLALGRSSLVVHAGDGCQSIEDRVCAYRMGRMVCRYTARKVILVRRPPSPVFSSLVTFI